MNSTFLKKALPHVIAIAVFFVMAAVYCKPAFDGKVVSQSDAIGWKGMAQQSIEYKEKNGHFPLWTESGFSGMPAYTIAMEGGSKITTIYFYYLLILGLPMPVYFFFLACVCFYILTQALRINPWVGIISAIGYAYSTFNPIIIAVGHNTQMTAIAEAPAVIAGFLLIFQKKYLLGTSLLAVLLGLQVGTQHLQIVYYTFFVFGFIAIFKFIQSWKEKEVKGFWISFIFFVLGTVVGLGTFAINWLPMQEYVKETKRGGKSELAQNLADKNQTKGGLDKDYAFMWSYGIPETFTLIVPNIYGGGSDGRLITDNSKFVEKASEIGLPEDAALQYANGYAYWGMQPNTAGPVYLGAVICFLAIFAIGYLRSWHKWWLVSIAILGIVLAWGKNFSALNYFLFDYFPFYNKFRAPTQALFLDQLAFPLLAALGVNGLLSDKQSKEIIWKKFKQAVYITSAIVVVLAAFYFMSDYKSDKDARLKDNFASQLVQSMARGKQPTPEMQQQAAQISSGLIKGLQEDRQALLGSDLVRTIVLIAIGASLLGLFIKGKIKEVLLIAGIAVISSYDLVAEARKYLNDDNFVEPADFESAFTPTAADLQISKDPDTNFRVFDAASGEGAFQDSRASYHHNSIGGYSPAKLGLYQDIIDSQLTKGNMMVYNMLNTKYFIERNPANGQTQASVNQDAFGPCWLVKNIKYVDNGNEEMKALGHTNVRDTAIVDKKFESIIKWAPVPDSSASIKLIDNKNDIIDYKFSSKTNQFAVFSEVYYDKGWNAYLDGANVPYCKTDYILRGMPVPAGDHTIEFRFEPKIYRLGNLISVWSSILAYLLVIGAIATAWKTRKRIVGTKQSN
ncbi:MAG: YfhO family protein [Bacteroidetes bacterium]|nr:YfhO family protein [Bacteroidota bacterium]